MGLSFGFIFQDSDHFQHFFTGIIEAIRKEEVQRAGGRELLLEREPAGRGTIAGGGDEDGDGVLRRFGLEGGEAGEGLVRGGKGGREGGEGGTGEGMRLM